ncbi:hypothetical protein L3X38_015591 [Prunus dulcis]|uniref:Uncharacterized protein n=1 Tax=Prunus dulcis TaxID=3755 RepID=A0AAD4Z8D0_PRUDU|nr:hypothetical protein L3X38_015591 [Prunus dulcis]
MCVQVCPTVLHQGHEKEERLASFPMLVVVLFQCINVLCLVEDFEEAVVCHVFIYEKQLRSFATTSKKKNEIPVMNVTHQLHLVYEIRLCPVRLENC